MKYNNLLKHIRSKPRLKLSNRIGYSLVKPSKFKNYHKRKWQKFTRFGSPNTGYKPEFQAGTSLNNLYGQRLKSKQALRTSYGKITERQFKNIIRKSEYGKATSNVNLRGLFERRLDVLVKRLGFAKTIFKSRQLVTHKFFKVNGRSVNSPSLILKVGDCISVADRVWDKVYFELSEQVLLYNKYYNTFSPRSPVSVDEPNARQLKKRLSPPKTVRLRVKGYTTKQFHNRSLRYRPLKIPKYMEFDYSTLTAILVSMPNQNNVLYENHINFKHIREFY